MLLSPCTTGTSPLLFHDFRNFALQMRGCNLALKCAHAPSEMCTARTGRKVVANVSETAKGNVEVSKNRKGLYGRARRATLSHQTASGHESGSRALVARGRCLRAGRRIETENISANGVLFRMDADVPVGSAVDFTISLPADVVGAEADVQVDCRGRVVRSFADGSRRGVGVVIDEYRFERK